MHNSPLDKLYAWVARFFKLAFTVNIWFAFSNIRFGPQAIFQIRTSNTVVGSFSDLKLRKNNLHDKKLTEAWKKIHYPPETASITLLVRILATIAQRPSPEESEELAQKYLTTFAHSAQELQLNVCHKLLGEQFAEQLETLRLATAKLFGHVECQALQVNSQSTISSI